MSRKIVLVTGASRGIGRAIAVGFGAAGYHVLVNYRRETAQAEQTVLAIRAAGGSAALCQADIAVQTEVTQMFAGISRLDVLVNNAGITRDAPLLTMAPADWRAVMETNFSALFYCSQAAGRLMAAAGHGVIVNIGSSAAASARSFQANYAAAKSGMLGFTRSLAREMAPQGVRVITLAPGYTETDMAHAVPDATVQETLQRIPLARWGAPAEIAAAAVFLASETAAGFCGQTIMVDGGRTVFETEWGV